VAIPQLIENIIGYIPNVIVFWKGLKAPIYLLSTLYGNQTIK
jgi:hypothetical protein